MPTQVHLPQLDTTTFNSSMARQAIINGNFDVWQRGTTVTPAEASTIYGADRWSEYTRILRSRLTLCPGHL